MDSSVEQEEKGLFSIIRVNGDFSAKTLRNIRDKVEMALGLGHAHIVFHLVNTRIMDSAGIGLLANLHKKLTANGGSAYLAEVPYPIQDLLRNNSLARVIQSFETIEEAEAQIG